MKSSIEDFVIYLILSRAIPLSSFRLLNDPPRLKIVTRKLDTTISVIAQKISKTFEKVMVRYKQRNSFLLPDQDSFFLLERVFSKNFYFTITKTLDLFVEFMLGQERVFALNQGILIWEAQDSLYTDFKNWLEDFYCLNKDLAGSAERHMRTHYRPTMYYALSFENEWIEVEGFKKPFKITGESLISPWDQREMYPVEDNFTWASHGLIRSPYLRIEGRDFHLASAHVSMIDKSEYRISTHSALRYIERRNEIRKYPLSRTETIREMVMEIRDSRKIDWKDPDTLALYNGTWLFLIDPVTKILKTCYPTKNP